MYKSAEYQVIKEGLGKSTVVLGTSIWAGLQEPMTQISSIFRSENLMIPKHLQEV